MEVVVGGKGAGKTRELVREFMEKHASSIMIVASSSAKAKIIADHKTTFELYKVNENRIIDPASFKIAQRHFKPRFVFFDDMQAIFYSMLKVKNDLQVGAMTIGLDDKKSSIKMLNGGR